MNTAALASPENHRDISRVRFAYNYLNETPAFLKPRGLQYNIVPGLNKYVKPGKQVHFTTSNAFTLDPIAAGLPWPTGLDCIRQSKFWQSGLSISSRLLELFASDEMIGQAVKASGKSLGSIAAHELTTVEEDRFTKFATYLFPEADEGRMRLLAASIVYIVIFDGRSIRQDSGYKFLTLIDRCLGNGGWKRGEHHFMDDNLFSLSLIASVE